jgi:hypothetical protein
MTMASGWLVKPESPFRRNGTVWHIASREDAWIHLAPRLTRAHLDHFARMAVNILSEDDPRFELESEQRAFAAIYGRVPRHSGELREGLAETLALLGAELVSLPALPPGMGPSYARKIVRELLPAGLTTHRWFTISPILKLLAEAAPEEFLEAVDRDIATPHPALIGLFEGDDGGIFGSSRHHYLMWALTSLAWHPAYLTRTALALARIATLEPGGRTSPRPGGSLHDIFRPWFPQTGANAAQRFEVIDLLVEREPEQAWKLLMGILPKGRDHASGTYPPRWREWPAVKKPQVTSRERRDQWRWTGERLIKLALPVPCRLRELAGNIDNLLENEFQALAAHLLNLDPIAMPAVERLALWNTLNDLIRRHEFFIAAEWRMTDEWLVVVKQIEAHLRPETPTERGRWLFAQHHLYLGIYRETPYEEQEAMALEQRKVMLTEIFAAGGVQVVAEFAASLSFPELVGNVLGHTSLCPEPSQVVPQYLDGEDPNIAAFGRGYVAVTFSERGWDWVETLPFTEWSPQAASQLLVVLPFAPRTWELAKSLGTDIENAYWARVRPYPRELSSEEAAQGLEHLLQHDRPLEAAGYLGAVYHNRLSVPGLLLAETLEKCVSALNETAEFHPDLSGLIHDVGEILGYLQEAPDNEPARVAELEWIYLPLMEHGQASPKFLLRELGRVPAFFAECVALIWRKDACDDGPTCESEGLMTKAKLANELLDSWSIHPALLADGGPDEKALREWIEAARQPCAAMGRANAGDHAIGKLLASSPEEADGSWPCITVRNVLESVPGDIALDSFCTGIFNSRGTTSRGMRDGGEQERELAKRYHGYADVCQMRWPRVAAILRQLAVGYEADGRYRDEEADGRG